MLKCLAIAGVALTLSVDVPDVNVSMAIDAVDGIEVENVQSIDKGVKYNVEIGGVSYEYYINGDTVTLLQLE